MGDRNMLGGVLIANEMVEKAKRCKKSCVIFKVGFWESVRIGKLVLSFLYDGKVGFRGQWIGLDGLRVVFNRL